MSRIVLSIDNGNRCLINAKAYLEEHGSKVYTLRGIEDDIQAVLDEIREKEGKLDMLLIGADERIPADGEAGGHDCEALLSVLAAQIDRTQSAISRALPYLRAGEMKRIGIVTKKESSVRCVKDRQDYGRHMAWAGINMVGRIYFNLLRPEGFTFRVFCGEAEDGGMPAGAYLLGGWSYDPKEPYGHSDENRYVMRDSRLNEIPW